MTDLASLAAADDDVAAACLLAAHWSRGAPEDEDEAARVQVGALMVVGMLRRLGFGG